MSSNSNYERNYRNRHGHSRPPRGTGLRITTTIDLPQLAAILQTLNDRYPEKRRTHARTNQAGDLALSTIVTAALEVFLEQHGHFIYPDIEDAHLLFAASGFRLPATHQYGARPHTDSLLPRNRPLQRALAAESTRQEAGADAGGADAPPQEQLLQLAPEPHLAAPEPTDAQGALTREQLTREQLEQRRLQQQAALRAHEQPHLTYYNSIPLDETATQRKEREATNPPPASTIFRARARAQDTQDSPTQDSP